MVDRIQRETGYTVHAYLTSVEQRVPTFWVMGVDESGRLDKAKAMCTADADVSPVGGLRRALTELAVGLPHHVREYENEPERAAQMVTNPALVRDMDDHSLLYMHPDAFERLDFLTSQQAQPYQDVVSGLDWPDHDDLTGDLTELVSRYGRFGMDVIVVDQTSAEHRAADLCCVKAIVPGTLPMTFGHRLRRVEGLDRIRSRPQLLGRRRQQEQTRVNPHPHPFP